MYEEINYRVQLKKYEKNPFATDSENEKCSFNSRVIGLLI